MRGKYERIGGGVTPAETWEEYRKLVLSELERFHDKADAIEEKVDGLENKVVTLETRMATIAALTVVGLTVVQIVLKFWRP